jgi:DnaK suppressor protein
MMFDSAQARYLERIGKMLDEQTKTMLKQRLLDEKKRLEDQIQHEDEEIEEMTSGQSNDSTYRSHMADDGGFLMDMDRTAKMRDSLLANLKQVNHALARMDNGTYGSSEISGKEIPLERLEALPWATRLVNE